MDLVGIAWHGMALEEQCTHEHQKPTPCTIFHVKIALSLPQLLGHDQQIDTLSIVLY